MGNAIVDKCRDIATAARRDIISMADMCGGDAHWGSVLSCVDALAVLYGEVLRGDINTPFEDRDKFILSKGHAALALYAVMAETGQISREQFHDFQKNGLPMMELTVRSPELGVDCAGGSLGLGLPMGVGLALLAKRKEYSYRTYVMVGDGECDEGSVWEAIMSAAQFGLNNLTLLVDFNGLQSDGAGSDIINMDDINARMKSFGWESSEINGHCYEEIVEALAKAEKTDKPSAIILRTVKGKGVSFMENDFTWHHRILSGELLEAAKNEVGLN